MLKILIRNVRKRDGRIINRIYTYQNIPLKVYKRFLSILRVSQGLAIYYIGRYIRDKGYHGRLRPGHPFYPNRWMSHYRLRQLLAPLAPYIRPEP